MSGKSRNLPLGEFLDVLSKEYMTAFVRSKVMRSSGDRKHWKRVSENKKRKIEDISDRNAFPNIFNDKKTYIRYFEMRSDDGLPLFLETNEDVEEYYGEIDAEVVVNVDGTPRIGKISSYSEENEECGVLVSGKAIKFDIRDIKRFL